MSTARGISSIHLSTATTWRGGENQIWLLAKGLKARGQAVLVVAPPEAPLLQRCHEVGIPTRGLALKGAAMPLSVVRLARLLKKERPDVLHLHDGHAILAGQLAARLAAPLAGRSTKRGDGLKLVAHRRTVFPVKGAAQYGGRVNCVIAISDAVRARLIEARVTEEHIRVVHSGLEFPEKMAPDSPAVLSFKERHSLPQNGVLIAHAGAFTAEKRHADMIEAVALANEAPKPLPHGRGSEIHLVLAGSGALEETLRALVRTRGLDGTVHFCGFLRDVEPLWAASDFAFFASEAEGLCTALIAAQAAGLPAVITRAGGMVEVVEENVTGVSVAVGDVEAMAAALVALATDSERRRRMGAAAARRARERFSADAMVEGVLRVYRDLC